MTNIKITALLLLFFSACNSDRSPSPFRGCAEPGLKHVISRYGCGPGGCSYHHTLMMDRYNDDCFREFDFVYLADKYLDSVTTDLPVSGITFMKPFDFKPAHDYTDDEPIREHSVVTIRYTPATMKNKVPEIRAISIWENGKSKDLDQMWVSTRQERMDYYNSQKK